jgi:hypothetical protein
MRPQPGCAPSPASPIPRRHLSEIANSRAALGFAVVLLAATQLSSVSRADDLDDQLAVIDRTGPGGAGSAAAREACAALRLGGADLLPRLLAAMETENPVAANWYRSAYEAIVDREFAQPSPRFPAPELQGLVRDPKRAGRVRRLALALCERLGPGFSASILPRMFDDPEFREDAVDLALAAGQRALDEGDSETARRAFHEAFDHARDSAQTVRAADRLARLGETSDSAAHLGLVVDWWLIGPFDAPHPTGFGRAFGPEMGVDLTAEYSGPQGQPIKWIRYHASDPLGLVNLIQALGPAKEAVGYAYTELEAPAALVAELRCGADDNCTVWLNGEKVFAREQWLNGIRLDRFSVPVNLKAGPNKLLVKICQGPQHKDPQVANNWSLQLRFCDSAGTGVKLVSLLPPPTERSP